MGWWLIGLSGLLVEELKSLKVEKFNNGFRRLLKFGLGFHSIGIFWFGGLKIFSHVVFWRKMIKL